MSGDIDKAVDLLMKLLDNNSNESDNEEYNEISDDEPVVNEIAEDSQDNNLFNLFSEVDDKRVTLLSSIKPYMNGKRQNKIDAAIQIVRFISLSSGLGITDLFKQ